MNTERLFRISDFGFRIACLLVVAALCAVVDAAPPALPATEPAVDPQRVTPVVLAYRKARPAVVSISAEKVASVGLFGDDPFEEIFPSPLTRRVPVQSLGSGVVIHPDGYIATNAHVVRKAEKITVTLADKKSYLARIIVADPDHDLAVLKVDPPGGAAMEYLSLGRSDDLMVGETVIAVGNPLGYSNSVTTEIGRAHV
jgi:serine protease Do